MGMSATVLAIGPFSADLVPHLEYPPEFYNSTRPGAIIVLELFGMNGSGASRWLAERLGISDPWDFNQHKVDASRIDFEGLKGFAKVLGDDPEFSTDLERLSAFRDHRFDFIFRPHG